MEDPMSENGKGTQRAAEVPRSRNCRRHRYRKRLRHENSMKGTSLLETVLALTVVTLMALAIGVSVGPSVDNAREEAVLDQLKRIKNGLVGDVRIMAPGQINLTAFGYVGGMGSLPASLDDLLAPDTQPLFSIDSTLQIGAGWMGPYIPSAPTDLTIDPWGNPIVLEVADGTSADTGAPRVALVRSLGPDGQNGTSDDYIVEIYEREAFSRVIGYVKDDFGTTVSGIDVDLSYPASGAVTTASTTTDSEGFFEFLDVPHGNAVLETEPKLIYQQDTALTTDSTFSNVEFFVENVARDSTAVTSFTLTYTSSPQAYFKEAWVDSVKIFDSDSPRGASGTPVTFSSETVNGTGVTQEPVRLQISGLIAQLPDTVIGTVGTGGTLKIELIDFQDVASSSGNTVEMTGVTFQLEFSDGSETLFTPKRGQ